MRGRCGEPGERERPRPGEREAGLCRGAQCARARPTDGGAGHGRRPAAAAFAGRRGEETWRRGRGAALRCLGQGEGRGTLLNRAERGASGLRSPVMQKRPQAASARGRVYNPAFRLEEA